MITKKLILFCMLLYPVFAYSQLINSNKSVIGEFYDAKVKSIELNGAKVVGQFRLVKFPTNYSFTDNSKVISAVKNNGFYLNLGLTNTNNEIFNVSKFDFKKNNGVTFGFAFQHSFSEIYLAIDSINNNPHTLQSYLISLDYKQDKFENFNPLTGQLTIASPDVISLRAVYNFYFFHYKHSAKTKYTFIPTLAGKINMKDYNGTKLLNYLRRENATDDLDVLFTSRTTFDGKYGAIDNNLTTAQVSVSLPIAFDRIFKNSPILCPIPYFSYDVFMNDKPRINGGIALGILSSPIVDLATNANGSSYYRKFNVPSYFSIGVDWNYQDGAGSKPNFYVAGSIKIQ